MTRKLRCRGSSFLKDFRLLSAATSRLFFRNRGTLPSSYWSNVLKKIAWKGTHFELMKISVFLTCLVLCSSIFASNISIQSKNTPPKKDSFSQLADDVLSEDAGDDALQHVSVEEPVAFFEEFYGEEALESLSTKSEEEDADSEEDDYDFEGATFRELPSMYGRLFREVMSDLLKHMLKTRLLPFIVCTFIYYAVAIYVKRELLSLFGILFLFLGIEISSFFAYWNGEIFSAITRKMFPSFLYDTGSIMFDRTVYGVDLNVLWLALTSFTVALSYPSWFLRLVPCFTIASICLSTIVFTGFPIIQQLCNLAFSYHVKNSVQSALKEDLNVSSCLDISLSGITVVSSYLNEGAEAIEYPESVTAHFEFHDTPPLIATMKEIGYESCIVGVLFYIAVIFLFPMGILTGLYSFRNDFPVLDAPDGVYQQLYWLYCAFVTFKFLANDFMKSLARRNFPFLLHYNGSLFADSAIYGVKAELFTVVASIVFSVWLVRNVLSRKFKSAGNWAVQKITDLILSIFGRDGPALRRAQVQPLTGPELLVNESIALDFLNSKYENVVTYILTNDVTGFFEPLPSECQDLLVSLGIDATTVIEDFLEADAGAMSALQSIVSLAISGVSFLSFALFASLITAWEFFHAYISSGLLVISLVGLSALMFWLDRLDALLPVFLISGSFMPWLYVFHRKEGIVSWTTWFRENNSSRISMHGHDTNTDKRQKSEKKRANKKKKLQEASKEDKKHSRKPASKDKKNIKTPVHKSSTLVHRKGNTKTFAEASSENSDKVIGEESSSHSSTTLSISCALLFMYSFAVV